MGFKRLKTAVLSGILVFVLFTGGCWDSHELDTLSIVTGIGIDEGQQQGEINFAVEIGKVKQSSSKEENMAFSGDTFTLLEVSSKNLLDAVEQLNLKSSRLLFMPHNEVIIFGRSQAEKGIRTYLDYFIRDDETRMEVRVFVADKNAKDILAVSPQQERLTAVALSRLMEKEAHMSDLLDINLLDFVSRLFDKATSPIAPIIKTVEENGRTRLALSGMAVFKDDRMVGQLSEKEISGYIWARGGIKGGVLDVSTPAGNAVLNISGTTCKQDVILHEGNRIEVSLKIEGQLSVGELHGYDNMKMADVFALLEQAAATEVNNEVAACFQASQQMDADIFGYGMDVYRKYPGAWETIKEEWSQLYPAITLSLETKIVLNNTGRIVGSLAMEEQ
jgi:spore germination protein KC